jgi:hypothetical protein
VTSTSTGTDALDPVRTADSHSFTPSPNTANRTEPRLPTSSSTPTVARRAEHEPPSARTTSDAAWTPRPFANVTPFKVIGPPSPAGSSAFDMLRSTGPQPFVAETQVRSLTYEVPVGGGAGVAYWIRRTVPPSRST